MKHCHRCDSDKFLEEFSKTKSSKDGYNSICKLCKKEYDKFYRDRKEYREKERLRNNYRTHHEWPKRFKSVGQNAKRRGIEFSISIEDVPIPDFCPLLNIPLIMGPNRWTKPSIDRIDSTKGYIPGNVWVISVLANTMKSIASKEQLIIFSKNILTLFDTKTTL